MGIFSSYKKGGRGSHKTTPTHIAGLIYIQNLEPIEILYCRLDYIYMNLLLNFFLVF